MSGLSTQGALFFSRVQAKVGGNWGWGRKRGLLEQINQEKSDGAIKPKGPRLF